MRLFLFGIGGTGSRVLKSMVMLLAAGVRPVDEDGKPLRDFEIVPIIIDPHKSNEDLKRTERMLHDYCYLRSKIHGTLLDAEGFFATKISTLHSIMGGVSTTIDDTFIYNMESVGQSKFRDFIGYDTMDESSQALTSLLFADYQLENKMNIGFVGSPNIGSVALNSIKDSEEFRAFANIFGDGDRIFFISSIFGGTGAAGFPIMVKNIRQAENLAVSNKHLLKHAPIGGLTVLPYFSLNNSQGRRIDKADFVVKTQSALQYYNETLTSRDDRNVNVIFYLGDQVPSMPYDYDPGDIKDQHDPAHLVEMVGALAPLKFAGMSNESIYDNMGGFRPTKAFEYGLERDVIDLDFASFGLETRSLIYKPMVKFRLLYMYLTGGFERVIGQGYTQDQPKIKSEFTGSQFYRTLTQSFFGGYTEWLDELEKNMRHVSLFNTTATDMGGAVKNVSTRKTLFGHKSINADVLNAEMNRISRDAKQYEHNTVEYKLLDLVDRAASKVIDDRLDNIN